ncbi:hypothetical protein TWF102_005915 [Orbilia oligospora]|uniref:CFEM domain-containing protein n=1 Tax=Orbilia oligospora TaxID=2813651 RepID=A0A7C8JL07_ORBOL|nr:hypothetical protein TWF102_005915 [Orbilia oligospora]KAF3108128.1 hypothetical protein TWF103_005687 [Orbilia oligospora]
MRFVSRLNLCLLILEVASARSIISAREEMPKCIQACLPIAIGATECLPTNTSCICDSQPFYESLIPCVLLNCTYQDVGDLLQFGVKFCRRTRVNSTRLQRLNIGFGKSTNGGSDGDDASVSSTSAAPVEPTPTPEPGTISSTQIEPLERLEVESSGISAPTTTTKSKTPSGLFSVESNSKLDGSNTELVVIQTADPTPPRNTQPPATTAPGSTFAPPTPTADEPSSASAITLHMFGRSSFNSFVVCLLALLLGF